MSINSTVKEEIITQKVSGVCCKRAFLNGVIRGAGSLPFEKGGFGLIIQNNSEALIEKAIGLITSLTKADPELIRKNKEMSLGERTVYEMHVPHETATPFLIELGILKSEYELATALPQSIYSKPCCKKSFLRGLFCASGSISISKSNSATTGGYNLDIGLTSQEIADEVCKLMSDMDIVPRVRERKNNYSVYLKDCEKIADFCTAMGANNAFFALQDIIMERSLRNDANRATNCELANIDRTLTASEKQLAAIAAIEKKRGLVYLSDELKDTAEARKAHPEATLNELAAMLRYPTSKSGLNHRLRRLVEIANTLSEGEL